jgi:primosomal protein N' (replication factor Y)
MERRAGRYRTQMLLQCANRPPLHQAISLLLEQARTLPAARQCRWHLDVDPIDML